MVLLKISHSTFSIVSPDNLVASSIPYEIALFGNPSIYTIYGKLIFYRPIVCGFLESFNSTDFIIVYPLYKQCFYYDFAYSVQKSGASAMILAGSVPAMAPKDEKSGNMINILVISIDYTQASYYENFHNIEIWATFQFDLPKRVYNPIISYYLTSNYTVDKPFFISLQQLNDKINIPISNISIYIEYENDSNYTALNCVNSSLASYCLNSTMNATGSQLLNNSIAIVNSFNNLQLSNSSLLDFLILVTDFYNSCEFNYSINCIENILTNLNMSIITSSDILDSRGIELINSKNSAITFFAISDTYFFWLNYLEELYCSISLNPSPNCTLCSPSCNYDYIQNIDYCNYCNTSSCGYSDLVCLIENNCYSFMLGDGNCNSKCINDTDCAIISIKASNNSNLIIILSTIFGFCFLFVLWQILVAFLYIQLKKRDLKTIPNISESVSFKNNNEADINEENCLFSNNQAMVSDITKEEICLFSNNQAMVRDITKDDASDERKTIENKDIENYTIEIEEETKGYNNIRDKSTQLNGPNKHKTEGFQETIEFSQIRRNETEGSEKSKKTNHIKRNEAEGLEESKGFNNIRNKTERLEESKWDNHVNTQHEYLDERKENNDLREESNISPSISNHIFHQGRNQENSEDSLISCRNRESLLEGIPYP